MGVHTKQGDRESINTANSVNLNIKGTAAANQSQLPNLLQTQPQKPTLNDLSVNLQ